MTGYQNSYRPAARQWRRKLFQAFLLAGIVAGFAGSIAVLAVSRSRLFNSDDEIGMGFMAFGMVITALTLVYFLAQGVLAFMYRRRPRTADAELPRCTVIVPAYNEGRYVATTLHSILECNYPADKLEIIAINDGSEDDTWEWISRTAAEAKGRIIPITLSQNGGKRRALYRGFRMATGSVVVTVDSDSRIVPDALRELVAPFADPAVGAVAGNIRVDNLKHGIIPRMFDVAFAFGFEFVRRSQCVIRSVLCTPGALSAYRIEAIRQVEDEWVDQTFLGRPSGIGEDRALSSIIIRQGWHVVYQSEAVAFTKMPTTYRALCKMLIRWCRSDVRENLLMLRFIFRRDTRFTPLLGGVLVNLVFQSAALLLPVFFLPFLVYGLCLQPLPCLGYTGASCIIWSSIPAYIYSKRHTCAESLWAFVYGFYFLLLSWISVYSVLTMRNSNWMTRNLPAEASARALFTAPPLAGGNAQGAAEDTDEVLPVAVSALPGDHLQRRS